MLERLAQRLQASAAAFGGDRVSRRSDHALLLFGANPWVLGGTDAGFRIPPPVTGLSASYQGSKVVLRWSNPECGYDRIEIVFNGTPIVGALPGNATQYTQPPDIAAGPTEPVVYVVGHKAGTPSNGTGIRLLSHVKQESLMDIPFTQGLAPGFETWTDRASGGSVRVEQGELPGAAPGASTGQPRPRGFYQVVRGTGTFRGGVCRTFLGLAAGHAYRPSARLNTLQAKEGEWTWSFHAAANPPGLKSLTAEQMAGVAELPDHSKGGAVGQIARYDYAASTKGAWVPWSAGAGSAGKSVGDITLPEGCDSITLWFRLEGTNADDIACGVDSLALEDLGKR